MLTVFFKKFFVSVFVGIGLMVVFPQVSRAQQSQQKQVLPSTVIDKVSVPFDVLTYAQLEYQGHAVTKVYKVRYGGESAYRLRVDRDDDPSDYKSHYLIFDKEWRLLDEAKVKKPVVIKENKQDKKKEKPKEEKKQEVVTDEPPTYRREPEPRLPDEDTDENNNNEDEEDGEESDEDDRENENTNQDNGSGSRRRRSN